MLEHAFVLQRVPCSASAQAACSLQIPLTLTLSMETPAKKARVRKDGESSPNKDMKMQNVRAALAQLPGCSWVEFGSRKEELRYYAALKWAEESPLDDSKLSSQVVAAACEDAKAASEGH